MSTWLVVEDEPNIYDLLMTMFQMWGIDGKAFTDGETAMDWIEDVDAGRYRGELPELALLDIRLPGSVSGPMVGERLRRSPLLGGVTIVLTTAYSLGRGEEISLILRTDADRLLYKPLPAFAEFRTILETALSERRARGGAPNQILPGERVIRASTRTPVTVGRGSARPIITTSGPRPAPSTSASPDDTLPVPPTKRPEDETR